MIERIAAYWDERSTSWLKEKEEAWSRPETEQWLAFFKDLRKQTTGNKALEVGTATGYFAHIMTLAGFEVTAVDLAPQMVAKAQKLSQELQLDVTYKVMDAQDLQFEDQSFDLVFTRLMTWTIPDFKKSYQEMHRVLKPGGKLYNFDGDFGKIVFSTDGHEACADGAIQESNAIKSALEISKQERPSKDLEVLETIGFDAVKVDRDAQNRILGLPQNGQGLFLIEATKV